MSVERSRPIVLSLMMILALLLPAVTYGAGPGLANVSGVDPALRSALATHPNRMLPVIVEVSAYNDRGQALANVLRSQEAAALLGGQGQNARLVISLPILGAAAGLANATALDALARNPRVAYIYQDSEVKARFDSYETQYAGQMAAPYPVVLRANKVWPQQTTGKGIAVAVFDSGIAPHDDLIRPTNRIVAAVNFAGDLGGMADPGGHGTHVAGIIAGNSTGVDLSGRQVQFLTSTDTNVADYVGVAPGANLIDVRVLDALGNGRISSVIAGIQWVLGNKDLYNIRIINLSIGAPITASYLGDPLSAAVEIAWKRGIVVVSAAGNRGPGSGGVETPGIDPYAIAVGANDDQGTTAVQDDVLGSFSSWGIPSDSRPKPDLVAPGRRVVSLRVPGSYLDQQMPDRVVTGWTGANYFRLTGTSMSAAAVSGVVALMLERQPTLRPDQVKAILTGTTQPYGQNTTSVVDPVADGFGLVNAYAAVNSLPLGLANSGLRPADSFARSLYPLLYGQPLTWKDPNYAGLDWSTIAWANLAWDNLAWDNLAWDNLAWDNLAWDNLAWDNLAWDNLAWDNLFWDSPTGGWGTLD